MSHRRPAAKRFSDPSDAAADAKVASDTLGGLYEITAHGRPPVYANAERCELHDEAGARQLVNRLQLAHHQWVRLLLDLQLNPERMFYDEREFGPWIAQMLTAGSLVVFRIPLPSRKLGVPGPKSLLYCFLPAPALPLRSDATLQSITTPAQARALLSSLDFSKASWQALFKGAGQELPSARGSKEQSLGILATLLAEGKVLAYALRNAGSERSTAPVAPNPSGGAGGAGGGSGSGGARGAGGGSAGSGAKAGSAGSGPSGAGGAGAGPAMGSHGAGGGPAPKPEPPKPVRTGLEESVDKLAAKSPSLQKDIKQLQADGWKIDYGTAGKGSFADRNSIPPKITIDSALQGQTEQATQTLAHEVGHALHPYKDDLSSKAAFLKGTLGDEGAATLNNIKVQREIIKNSGPDIGIAGNPANHAAYTKAYDQMLKDGNAAAARDAIGTVFGSGEQTSTTLQSYADYYGGWYDQSFPPKK